MTALGIVGAMLTQTAVMYFTYEESTADEPLPTDQLDSSEGQDAPKLPGATVASPEMVSEAPDPVVPEKLGVALNPDARTADLPVVPAEVVDDCETLFSGKLDSEMKSKLKDGLLDPGFSIEFRGMISPYPLISTMCSPGENLRVTINEGEGDYRAEAEGGRALSTRDGREWRWQLPTEPGIYCLKVEPVEGKGSICLHGMVTVPYNGSEKLEGYQIGKYESKPLRNNPRYKRPEGFIRVTKQNRNSWVSPHLQLKQFLCKQSSAYPKFVLIETRLLLKLEAMIEQLESEGIRPDTVYITSGFRTPYYNRKLGNKTKYSRHLYGDAADLFVDTDGDYRLDDLNRDGKVDDEDAKFLSKVAEDLAQDLPEFFEGGLGFYGFKPSRTAFIHTDTRGYRARWGFTSSTTLHTDRHTARPTPFLRYLNNSAQKLCITSAP